MTTKKYKPIDIFTKVSYILAWSFIAIVMCLILSGNTTQDLHCKAYPEAMYCN